MDSTRVERDLKGKGTEREEVYRKGKESSRYGTGSGGFGMGKVENLFEGRE
jgi:hypothetical protein